MARFKTINDIVNQVAVETGLQRQADIFATADASFDQLITLANSCGYELLQSDDWQNFNRTHTIVTQSTDTGIYDLPDDYAYMIDQTAWELTNNVPVGNLSAQEWTYLKGSDLVSYTIYASFRLNEGKIWIFPYANSSQEVPDGLTLEFEYASRNWVNSHGVQGEYDDKCVNPDDIVLFEPYMFERLLKARFLEARGFDSSMATEQLNRAFTSWVGKDKSAPILDASQRRLTVNYLSDCNAPDTGFGK
jgi:hypothetical protein